MASSSGTSAAVFTSFWIFVVTSADQQQITVKPGDYVTLPCLDPRGGDIELLVWTRRDPEEDVFVWKHGNMLEDQHESFKNRVELRDSQMKDGDVSLIVKNVTINDTGTYECRVRYSNTQPPPQLITNLLLTVTDSGQKAGRTEDGGEKDGRNKDGGDKDGGDKDGGKKDVGDKGGGDKDGDASGLVVCLLCVNVLLIDAVIVFMILKWKDLKCFRSLPNPLVKPH